MNNTSLSKRASLAFEHLLALAFLVAALVYFTSGLCAIANFAWRQPLLDQFRLYDTYLSLPFPQNVIQLENGHRPIVPSLVRVAEIHWLHANQSLQIGLGAAFAVATASLVALFGWRSRDLGILARAACVMCAVLGLFWLANARMLLHGNELVHAYLVMFCVVVGSYAVFRAATGATLAWMMAATLCAALATFSFGPGIATFPMLLILGWLQRLPVRTLLVPAAGLGICLAVYLFVLPGDNGVRGQLEFSPVETVAMSTRWLSSPWIVSWLGLGERELYGWAGSFMETDPLASFLMNSADTMQRGSGLRWSQEGSTLIGAFGICFFFALCAKRLLRLEPPGQLENTAIALCLFGIATALIVSLGRLRYLQIFPFQVFADRYLLWPCLFWLGLALLLLHRLATIASDAVRCTAIATLLMAPIIAWPTHTLWVSWGATVYRNAQQSAASARSNAFDARHFNENAAASLETTLRTLSLLRAERLAMYAEPGTELLGQTYNGVLATSPQILAYPTGLEALHDLRDGKPIARFEGWITSGIKAARRHGFLAALDSENRIVGFADYSFLRPNAPSLRFDLAIKRGFDGYINHYDPALRYRIAIINGLGGEGVLLYEIGPGGGS